MKKIIIVVLGCLLLVVLSACGNVDYSGCISIKEIMPSFDEKNNFLEFNYVVNNTTNDDDLSFRIKIDNEEDTLSLSKGVSKSGTIVVDIGKPTEYDLNFNTVFEVLKNDKVLWNKEDTINYDCTEMFSHKANVTYKDQSVSIELLDYQDNFFDLNELFENFESDKKHNLEIVNGKSAMAKISNNKNDSNDKWLDKKASGSILKVMTFGSKQSSDAYRFSDEFTINILDATTAKDVDWDANMRYSDTVGGSELYGVSLLTFTIIVNNPSDERIKGKITEFYANDKLVPDGEAGGKSGYSIFANDEGEINCPIGVNLIRKVATNVNKIGMRVVLEDEAGNVLYNDIKWKDMN